MRNITLESGSAVESNKIYTFNVSRKNDPKITKFKIKNVQVKYNPVESSSVTAADVEALDLKFWYDFKSTDYITPNPIADGDDVTNILPRTGTDSILMTASSANMFYNDFGSHMKGIFSNSNWHNYGGSGAAATANKSTFFINIRTASVVSGMRRYFHNDKFKVLVYGSVLSIQTDDNGTVYNATNLLFQGNNDYLITIRRDGMEAECWVYNYAAQNEVTQTLTLQGTDDMITTQNWSNAQTGAMFIL